MTDRTEDRVGQASSTIFTGIFCAVLASLVPTADANAADLQEFVRLSAEGTRLLDALRDAQGEVPEALRLEAIEADRAIIEWLDGFFEEPEFAQLPETQQAAAHSDQNHWLHNLAVQLVALEQCRDAGALLADLSNAEHVDESLAALIAELDVQAQVCIARQNEVAATVPVTVSIDSNPTGARVLIDSEPVGTTPYNAELDPGDYMVTLQSDGYESHDMVLSAQDEALEIGPITLSERYIPDPPQRSPGPVEWTLWGAGAVGVGTAVFTIASSGELAGDIRNPPAGQQVVDSAADWDTVQALDTATYIAGTIGLAAAVTGTVLYFLQDGESAEDDDVDVSWRVGIGDVSVGLIW